jgi:hypothetical protein
MSSEKRRHLRTPLNTMVKVWHESFGEAILPTRDISDGGMFLDDADNILPPAGELIEVQVQGIPDAPIIKMEIMRDGAGARFISK